MNRNHSIDNIRLLAIFCIIVMHSFPFFYMTFHGAKTLMIAVNQITRFGVPCFFTISGFLYAQRVAAVGAAPALRKTSLRLLLLYFAWCIFYVIPYNVPMITATEPRGNLNYAAFQLVAWTASAENFLLGGSRAHLWFLPALWCATAICTPFIARRLTGAMLLLTSMIFVIALLAGPYKNTLLTLELPIAARNGPLFSSIFFAAGAALASTKKRGWFFSAGILLTIAGGVGQLFETFRLVDAGYNPTLPVYPDFVISTLPFGIGVALIGLSGAAARSDRPWLWGLGRYTLGIYTLHFFVMDFFIVPANSLNTHLWWQIGAPLLYFTLTAILVLCLARIRRLRPLIT